MMSPARGFPQDEPGFTGWEGKAGVPSPSPAPEVAAAPSQKIPSEPADSAPPAADPSRERMAEEAEMAGAEVAHEDRADPAGVAYAPPPAEPVSPAGAAGTSTAVDAVADGRWSKIQAMFVDDPRNAVAEAAALADEAVGAFIATVRAQQAALTSSWQAEDADTEQLRTAFREYRTFWNGVTGLSQSA